MDSSTALRSRSILPFFNIYTVGALTILAGILLNARMNILARGEAEAGIHYLYVLMLVQAIPVVISFTRRHFTYLSFVMMNHMVMLSIPKWFQFMNFNGVPKLLPRSVEAVQEQTFCTILIMASYFAIRILVFTAVAEKERYHYLTLKRWQVTLLGGYVLLVPLMLNYLPSWFLTVHFLLLSADVVMLFTATCPGSEKQIFWLKVAVFVEAFEYFLRTGMMTMMGALVSFFFLISCLEKRYWRVALIMLGVIFMSAIQSVKGNYRAAIRSNPEMAVSDRAVLLGELLSLKYIEDVEDVEVEETDDKSTYLVSGFMRAGDDSLERVLEYTPERVPYWHGETYETIPYMFIPRALWPEKPSRHFWNKFGRMYGVLSTDDYETSVGISFLAEGYINFGYSGMYLIAIIVGCLIAVVEKASASVLSGYFFFPYIILLSPLLAPGTDLGSMLQSLWVLSMFMFGARPLLIQMARRDDYG